ncbi:hypothetical protein MLD38_015465 [Melastoma candidum]|uniref:Uncharacterized protein n=1 Tax=Melastoma candidum TaxID=119954 RepID=A0ACB9RGA7_9MYRT|nr:hypothetical protein MLD38_015465 [Melastoma candidum]
MSSLLFILILFTSSLLSPCFSSSSVSQPILLPLVHSLSGTTARYNTTHHLLRSTSSRSAARFHRHFHHPRRPTSSSPVSLPLSPGSDYTLSLTLPTAPPRTVSLFMDTGSDLVWFPCSPFSCILCEGKQSPDPVNITSSASRVSCSSAKCSAAHSYSSSSDLCAIARCPLESIEMSECSSYTCPQFYYAYGDGSFIATLYEHAIAIDASSAPSLVINNFTFGCAHSALAEPVGVAGFGRGVLSLPAQLAMTSPQLGSSFSYCLVSHSFDSDRVRRPSPLILGRYGYDTKSKTAPEQSLSGGFSYTKMLDNPKHPYFYCVGLEGISVGGTKIPAPASLTRVDRDGNGGMVVDSGTTYTMLPSSLYAPLAAEFDRKLGKLHERAIGVETSTGLSPCYYFDGKNPADIPSLVLHFKSNNTSGVVLPRENYLYEFVDESKGKSSRRRVGCLMMMDGGDEEEMGGGPVGILGNYQQQGFEVVYDLEKRRVGFARRHCASLWEGLVSR